MCLREVTKRILALDGKTESIVYETTHQTEGWKYVFYYLTCPFIEQRST